MSPFTMLFMYFTYDLNPDFDLERLLVRLQTFVVFVEVTVLSLSTKSSNCRSEPLDIFANGLFRGVFVFFFCKKKKKRLF